MTSIYPYEKHLLMVVMHNNTVFCKTGHNVKYGAVLVNAFKMPKMIITNVLSTTFFLFFLVSLHSNINKTASVKSSLGN